MNAEKLERMLKIKLLGMHRSFKISLESGKEEAYTLDEIIAHLVEAEWE